MIQIACVMPVDLCRLVFCTTSGSLFAHAEGINDLVFLHSSQSQSVHALGGHDGEYEYDKRHAECTHLSITSLIASTSSHVVRADVFAELFDDDDVAAAAAVAPFASPHCMIGSTVVSDGSTCHCSVYLTLIACH